MTRTTPLSLLIVLLVSCVAWAQEPPPSPEAPPRESPEVGAEEESSEEVETPAQDPSESEPADSEVDPEPEPEPEPLSRVTIMSENDKFAGTDRFYTNGFKAAYQRTDVGSISDFFSDMLNLIPFLRAKPLAYGFVIGQDIYTPENTETPLLIPNDRPYGAWLYAGVTLTRGNVPKEGDKPAEAALFQDRIEILFGVIGVDAMGREIQNNWHEVINVSTAKGWRNQLRSEVGLEIYTQRKWLLEVWPGADSFPGADFLPHLGLAIGHPFTHVSIGGTFRLGWNLGEDFGPVQRIASAGFDRPRETDGFQFYLYGRVEARMVLWNAFIQGNLYHNGRERLSINGIHENIHVDIERFVSDFEIGAVLRLGWFEVSYTHVFRTREFEEQRDSFVYGAIQASVTF